MLPLAGGRLVFGIAELILRLAPGQTCRASASIPEILAWGRQRGPVVAGRLDQLLSALTRRRPPFAGLDLRRPRLMGVVNVTPDSFSDGGDFFDAEAAVARGRELAAAGAELLDVGGESTRPGAEPVSEDEEIQRAVPVIRALAGGRAPVSVDTRHARVMSAALEAGARVLNDVTALTGDPDSLGVAARSRAALVLMHIRGEPRTMLDAPVYDDAALDVFDWLEQRLAACTAAGIAPSRIAVDPGIGFGKTLEHNLDILRQLSLFHGLGCPLLLGVSRKRFIAALSQGEAPKERLPGTLVTGHHALNEGVQMLRVHDVAAAAQARTVWEALVPLSY
jgi:dihydropteroate synthase